MATEGRNISAEVAHMRDTVLDAEKEYLVELKRERENLEKIERFKRAPLKKVVEYGKYLMESMELGYIKKKGQLLPIDEELAKEVEKELVLAMASIEDAILARELTKTRDLEDEGMGMSM